MSTGEYIYKDLSQVALDREYNNLKNIMRLKLSTHGKGKVKKPVHYYPAILI